MKQYILMSSLVASLAYYVWVLQLCFLDEDLKTNIFGSRPAIMKMKEISPNGHFGGLGTDSQNKNCFEILMAKEMGLDMAPIEFQTFYFSHVLVVPPNT